MKRAEAFPRRAAGWVGFSIIVALSSPRAALADITLLPSPDGYIGAFLVAGPLPRRTGPADVATPAPAASAKVGERLGWLTWSLRDGGLGSIDLNQRFVLKERRAALTVIVSAPEPVDGLLLVAADGYLTVGLDDASVFTRPLPHPRGNGWDPIPISIPQGEHTLSLILERRGGPWTVEARLLSRKDLEPPRGVTFRLPGTTDADQAALAPKLARATFHAGLVGDGYQPRVDFDFPRGAPLDPALRVTVGRGPHASTAATKTFGIPTDGAGAVPLTVFLGAVATAKWTAPPDDTRVQVGASELVLKAPLPADTPNVVKQALALLPDVKDGRYATLADRDVVAATLVESMHELAGLADRGDAALAPATKRLAAFVAEVTQGHDPIQRPGVLALARPSKIDGAPDAMRIHVPRGYAPGGKRRYPLVVVLHGYNGSPESVMNAFLGTESLSPQGNIDGFVLAPDAHGNAFYRGSGETETIDAIDWMLRTYPIDPDRVSITGISMGGTGTAHLAFRYPDRFSAAAALAGYHSYFVRRDVSGKPLREWEWMELSRWSPASYADNGLDLFLYVTQGTRDLPLEHSTSLADRYHALGYDIKEEYPDIGHDVWRVAWENGKLFPFLAGYRRKPEPARIVLQTDSLRFGKRAWVTITDLEGWGRRARVDASVAPGRLLVKTSGTTGIELARPTRWLKAPGPVLVTLDGQRFTVDLANTEAFHREGGTWNVGARPRDPGEKRAGLEGPIRDAFASGPLAFVYGTLDPSQTVATREIAEHFRARWAGSTDFPIYADVAVPTGVESTHSLFIVGSKDANSLARDLDGRLPIGIDADGVRLFDGKITGDAELGFACVRPNPDNPNRLVVLLEARSALGLYRSLSLPMQLPDFIVFDSGLAPAAGQQILGEGRALAAGYFDRDWNLPDDFADRIAIPPGADGARYRPPPLSSRIHAASATAPAP